MARRDRLGDLALDLDADVIGQHDVGCRGLRRLAKSKGCRKRRGRWVRQKSVHPVRRDRELRVVVVVRVDTHTVRKGGEIAAQAAGRTR